jgi:hypothetical protein
MPMKQILKVVRTKTTKRMSIGISFSFDEDDPRAPNIFRGIGLCLKEALTDEEARALLDRLEIERAKLLATAPASARKKQRVTPI